MKCSSVIEAALWAVVAASAGYSAFCLVQAEGTRFFSPVHAQRSAADTDGPIVQKLSGGGYASGGAIPDGSVIGSFSIPALQLSVPIVEGTTHQDLLRGVGHVPGSALAGGLGNMALAAHRDTFFRPLRNVRAGMQMRVASGDSIYQYQVDSTEIVTPEQVAVLDIGSVPQVTLITCYPFSYIGAAPRRFIVHAHLTSLVPVPATR